MPAVEKQEAREARTERKRRTANGTLFVCNCSPEASEVYLVGQFNNWDPKADRMSKAKGTFQRRKQLEPGVYEYKFLVDGEWHTDPAAETQVPNEFGTLNSVIRV